VGDDHRARGYVAAGFVFSVSFFSDIIKSCDIQPPEDRSMSQMLLETTATDAPSPVPRITVDQYHEAIAGGMLPECAPFELLDGVLVWKDRSRCGDNLMSHDPRHANAVARLHHLNRRLDDKKYVVRAQLPVTIPEWNEPEPDLAIARGNTGTFAARHPGPSELLAAMEVSHSSLRFDRSTKLRKYAGAAIPQYWIVNLPENQIEVYTEPKPSDGSYGNRQDFRPGQTVRLLLDESETLDVAVADILPS
jgi:Uma2 family endonuclease